MDFFLNWIIIKKYKAVRVFSRLKASERRGGRIGRGLSGKTNAKAIKTRGKQREKNEVK